MQRLVEFLAARLVEDEAVAFAVRRDGSRWELIDWGDEQNHSFGHRWNPARVLEEIDAKWRVLAYCEGMDSLMSTRLGTSDDASILALEFTLPSLTLPYADHPEYRSEWSLPPRS
jgi:hypothetical protein